MVWRSLTEVQKGSQSLKNIHVGLSLKWEPKYSFKFQFRERKKSAFLRTWFDQPYLRVEITRNLAKIYVHAYLLHLLDQPWIMTKIALNIVKVGIHSYITNAQIKLWSNFSSGKLVKIETLLCGFPKVALTGGWQYLGTTWTFTCTLVYQMGIQTYDQISILRNCSKVKLHCTVSLGLGLKEVKIAWNIVKVGVHACVSNGKPNLSSSFSFEKLFKSESPPCGFARFWLKWGENSS